MALTALTVFCVAFQFIEVLLETRDDDGSEGLMTYRVSVNLKTLQSFTSVPIPRRGRLPRFPERERRRAIRRTLPTNKATEEQRVERSFGHRQRLHKTTKKNHMFLNSQESPHASDKQQVTPSEDKHKDPGILVSFALDSVCQPKNHIVFLKTHKTASSTIVNILYRYGDERNLTFGLPVHKYSQFFYPQRFATTYVEGVHNNMVREYHIICNHLRFNKPELDKLMPEDTFYFSIMRHPVTMFESAFTYYKGIQAFHSSINLEDFLDRGWQNYSPSVANNQYAHNNLAFDFGFDNNIYNSTDMEERAQAAVAAIEQDFHLVLITEYFDESMVLLKHALCWSLEDVVSFKLNSRSEQSRHMPLPHIADKITAWNELDWRLYIHFNATFWRTVDITLGREEMAREVGRLRQRRDQLQEGCLQDGGPVNPEHVKDNRLKPFQYGEAVIQGYNLKPALEGQTKMKCQKLIMPELQYSGYLYKKQFEN
ncbi:Galactose-3-O-sulfotransferase 2 [Merluccius polli]|uniref:Galactose-3-O-sulfotransferase 2 n=1 Tax=Merluccius polli TaxID=89951 RepID=A0AA47MEM5_MERPO|nr:Galactose-3-O-sulfotransferase 2 [Merluccius polli]